MALLRTLLLLLLALLLLAIGATILWREEAALYAFDRWLEAKNLEGSVEALSIGYDRIELEGPRLEQAEAERVLLTFQPSRLLGGDVPAIEITGLRLPVDLTGEGPPLKKLQSLFSEAEDEAEGRQSPGYGELPPLDEVRLLDARLLLDLPEGSAEVALDALLQPSEDEGASDLTLNFTARGPQERQAEGGLTARLQDLRPTNLRFNAGLRAPDLGADGRIELSAQRLEEGAPLAGSLTLTGPAESLVSLLPEGLPRPEGGALALELTAEVSQPPLPYLDAPPPDDWRQWAMARKAAGDLVLTIDEVYLPDRLGQGGGALALGFDYDEGRLEAALTEPASLLLHDLQQQGLQPIEKARFAIEELDLLADFREKPQGELTLRAAPGPLSVTPAGAPDEKLELAPRSLGAELSFNNDGAIEGHVEVDLEKARLPGRQLALSDVRMLLPLSDGAPLLQLDSARLLSEAEPATFPALQLTGVIQRDLHFTAEARGLNDALALHAEGRHDAQEGRGTAALILAPIAFAPDGLQPAALGPYTAGMSEVSGQMDAEARLSWADGVVDGSARLGADDLAFDYAGSRVEGLNAVFNIARLRPPRTAEPQRVTIERIDAGFSPLSDIELWLSLLPASGGGANPAIESARASFAEGAIQVRNASVDAAAELYQAQVELEHLNLEELLALIGLEELRGEGRVSGSIPVELRKGTITVDGGLLQGDGPGVIAFRSPDARSALEAGGEAVSLMLDALENFHYEQLEIGLDKPPAGETIIHLRLLGANPDVLDGHPFDLNINLETDAAPLLEAFAQSRRIQQGVLDELWRLVR